MTKITKTKYLGNSPDAATEIVIEEISNDTDDRIFELEKQLHEQYAVNNNSNAGILVSLISALLISFTGYGYVLYQYSIGECAIGIVNLAAITVMGVMTLIYFISVNLGAGQRMEQFITFGIRAKYYHNKTEQYNSIFPRDYHPFNKKYFDFVQGMYNTWTKVALFAIIGVCCCDATISYHDCGVSAKTCGTINIIVQAIACVILCLSYRYHKFAKYLKREDERKNDCEILLIKLKNRSKDGKIKKWIKRNCIYIAIAIFSIVFICCIAKDILRKHENTLNIGSIKCESIIIQIID